jgi:integrase/recombinase XerD
MERTKKKSALLTPDLEAYIERYYERAAAEASARGSEQNKLRVAWSSPGGRAFRRFIETRPALATRKIYTQHIADFLSWLSRNAGGIDLLDATPEDLARYERDVLDRVSSATGRLLALRTRQDRIRTIRTAYRFCLDEELIDRSPARHLRVRGRAQPKRSFLTDDAAVGLIRACRGDDVTDVRDRSLITFLLHTGLRAAEAASLSWEGLSKPPNVVATIEGKGRVVRSVPVSDEAYRALCEWSTMLNRGKTPSGSVWLTIEHRMVKAGARVGAPGVRSITSHPLSAATVYAIVKKRATQAGLENVTPHTLRRTFATKLKRLGVALDSIQRYLGHSSILTTAGYFDPNDDDALGAVKKLRYD